jgi:hypothetical protein
VLTFFPNYRLQKLENVERQQLSFYQTKRFHQGSSTTTNYTIIMPPQENFPSTAAGTRTAPGGTNVKPIITAALSDLTSTVGGGMKPSLLLSSSSSSIHVVVTKDVPPEHQEKWLDMANELAAATWKEPGCISYDFVRSKEGGEKGNRRFVIVEEVSCMLLFLLKYNNKETFPFSVLAKNSQSISFF